ncbi:hypothetical protein WAJ09_21850, partial [Acinetobacter baumannii]
PPQVVISSLELLTDRGGCLFKSRHHNPSYSTELARMNTGETEGFENLMTVVELHIKELNTSAA